MTDIVLYIALILLLALSAFFSGSEISIAHANVFKVRNRAENGEKKAKTLLKIMDDFTGMISTVLVGNNLVNIAFSSVITMLAVEVWFPSSYTPAKETAVTVLSTLAILVFGEIFPKIVFAENAEKYSLFVAKPLEFCYKLFLPIVKGTTYLVNKMSKLWTPKDASPTATAEELVTMVEEIEDEGVFTEKESDLIRSAIEFTDISAREIMIPRVDVIGFDLDLSAEDLMKNEELLSFSRFPVYKDSLDNIVGVLSSKKFIREMVEKGSCDIEKIMFPPIYVHMTRTISSILDEFRKTHSQMAIVLDEYGGTMGILTLEDILEEIVGEIYDERDDVEEDFIKRGNSFEVDGGANIEDCFEEIEFNDPDFESEYTTVGGWATEMLDKFPEVGESFTYKNLSVKILEADEKRVEKVLIEILPQEEKE